MKNGSRAHSTRTRFGIFVLFCVIVFPQSGSAEENAPSWERPYPSGFVLGRADLGVAFARVRLSLGWGHAHERWLGIEADPILSVGSLGGYGGVRFQLPWVNLRGGARYVRSLQRSFLAPQNEVDEIDFLVRNDGRARYWVFETELTYDIPAGPGGILGEVAYSAVVGVPEDQFVFEERIRVVLDPPHVWRARAGYGFRLRRRSEARIAPSVELVGNPARDLVVVRAGLIVRIRLWDSLQVRLTFLPPIKTRDDFGIAGGDFGLGVRYRWAWLFRP